MIQYDLLVALVYLYQFIINNNELLGQIYSFVLKALLLLLLLFYIYIYIYIYVCVCVCVCKIRNRN